MMTLEEIVRKLIKSKGHEKVNRDTINYIQKFWGHMEEIGAKNYVSELERWLDQVGLSGELYDIWDGPMIGFFCETRVSKVKEKMPYYRMQDWVHVMEFLEKLGESAIEAVEEMSDDETEQEEKVLFLIEAHDQLQRSVWKAYNDEKVPESFELLELWGSCNERIYQYILDESYISGSVGQKQREKIRKIICRMEEWIEEAVSCIEKEESEQKKRVRFSVQKAFEKLCWTGDYSIDAKTKMEIKNLLDKIEAKNKKKGTKRWYDQCIDEWKEMERKNRSMLDDQKKSVKSNEEEIMDNEEKEIMSNEEKEVMSNEEKEVMSDEEKEIMDDEEKEIMNNERKIVMSHDFEISKEQIEQKKVLLEMLALKYFQEKVKISDVNILQEIQEHVETIEKRYIEAVIPCCEDPILRKEMEDYKDSLRIRLDMIFQTDIGSFLNF